MLVYWARIPRISFEPVAGYASGRFKDVRRIARFGNQAIRPCYGHRRQASSDRFNRKTNLVQSSSLPHYRLRSSLDHEQTDLDALRAGRPLPKDWSLSTLRPFVKLGLLCVEGRIGAWERLIGTAKRALGSVLYGLPLTDDVLETALVEVS